MFCVNWPQVTDQYTNEINRITWCIRCARINEKRVIIRSTIGRVRLAVMKKMETYGSLKRLSISSITAAPHATLGSESIMHVYIEMYITLSLWQCRKIAIITCFFDHIQFHLTWDQPQTASRATPYLSFAKFPSILYVCVWVYYCVLKCDGLFWTFAISLSFALCALLHKKENNVCHRCKDCCYSTSFSVVVNIKQFRFHSLKVCLLIGWTIVDREILWS